MWVEDIDDVSVEYEEDGVLKVRQEDRVVVTRGAWPVVLFLYREYDAATGGYGPPKVTLRKFRKQRGTYRIESRFNIGSLAQAAAIASVLDRWAAAGSGTEGGGSQDRAGAG